MKKGIGSKIVCKCKRRKKAFFSVAITLSMTMTNGMVLYAGENSNYILTDEKQAYFAVADDENSYNYLIQLSENEGEQPKQLEENCMALLNLTDKEADRIEKIQGIASLEKNILFTANEVVPIDEDAVDKFIESAEKIDFSQWNLEAIHLPEDSSLTGEHVKIAILDSGISYTDNIKVQEYVDLIDSCNENPMFDDTTGHGTSMAGVVAASGGQDNLRGIAENAE